MASQLFADLAWMQRPPADFGRQCRSVLEGNDNAGQRLRALANCALDTNRACPAGRRGQNRRVRRDVRWHHSSHFVLDWSATARSMWSPRRSMPRAARYGIDMDCVTTEYAQADAERPSPDSHVNRARPDAVLVAVDYRAFPLRPTPGDRSAADKTVAEWLANLAAMRDGIRDNTGAVCIFQTLAPPPEGLFGHSDRILPGTARWLVDSINRGIVEQVMAQGDLLLDIAALAETVGLADWHSPPQWNMAKLPFADTFFSALCRPCRPGWSPRCAAKAADAWCLISTTPSGAASSAMMDWRASCVAQGDAVGRGPLSVQRLALALRDRGIILAVVVEKQRRNRPPAVPQASRDVAS